MRRRVPARLLVAIAITATALAAPAAPGAGAGPEATVTGVVRANPLTVDVSLPRSSTPTGRWATAVATVENGADDPLEDLHVRLRVDEDDVVVRQRGSPPSQLRDRATSSFRLCSLVPGSYAILAEAAARTADGRQVEAVSTAVLLRVEAGGRARCR